MTQRNVLSDEICAVLEDGDDDDANQWEFEGQCGRAHVAVG